MSAQPYHKRYHSDALSGFLSLTLEERGAYQTILDMIYDRGGAIPGNPRLIAGYMNCSLRKWATLQASLIGKGKIYILADGSISNRRAEKEIENYAKTSRKLAENGAKGGRNKREPEEKGNENNENENQRLEEGLSLPEARSQKPKKEDKPLSDAGLPEWLPPDEWAGFRAMRDKIKKPLTDRAAGMAITKLSELRDIGHDPGLVLDQSTLHCWQDLYPPKDHAVKSGEYEPVQC